MMLVTGGAVAGASALMAAPFRDEIASTARTVLASTGVGRALLSLANASYEEWAAQVGSTFSLGGATRLRLTGVTAFPDGGTRPSGIRRRSFAAVFDPVGRGVSVAPDLIYTAVHPEYGPLPLFLNATNNPQAPGRMIAVFG